MADEYGVPVILHMAEMINEKDTVVANFSSNIQDKSVVQYVDGIGFIGPNVLADIVIYIDEDGMVALKARGVGVSHNAKDKFGMDLHGKLVQSVLM